MLNDYKWTKEAERREGSECWSVSESKWESEQMKILKTNACKWMKIYDNEYKCVVVEEEEEEIVL